MEKTVVIKSLERNFGQQTVTRLSNTVQVLVPKLSRGGYNTGIDDKTAKRLEEEIGLKEGALHNRAEFWKTYGLILDGKGKELTIGGGRPEDEIDYYVALAHPKIANSEDEINTLSEYVLVDSSEINNQKAISARVEAEAMSKLVALNVKEKADVLKIYGYNVSAKSDDDIIVLLHEKVKDDPKGFINTLNQPGFKTKVFIKELEFYNILRLKGRAYYYNDPQNVIGNNIDETVSFLEDKNNNAILTQLKADLQKAKKAI